MRITEEILARLQEMFVGKLVEVISSSCEPYRDVCSAVKHSASHIDLLFNNGKTGYGIELSPALEIGEVSLTGSYNSGIYTRTFRLAAFDKCFVRVSLFAMLPHGDRELYATPLDPTDVDTACKQKNLACDLLRAKLTPVYCALCPLEDRTTLVAYVDTTVADTALLCAVCRTRWKEICAELVSKPLARQREDEFLTNIYDLLASYQDGNLPVSNVCNGRLSTAMTCLLDRIREARNASLPPDEKLAIENR